MKEKLSLYILLVIGVPLAGELNFYPFDGDLRVSLGTPVFFLILLMAKKVRPISAGLLVGIAVVVCRIFLDFIRLDSFLLSESFAMHLPVFFYYFCFASLFQLLKVSTFYYQPLMIGLLGIILEFIATIMEISMRTLITNESLQLYSFQLIAVIAFFRSFFVLGFFNIFIIRDAKIAEEEQRKRNEKLFMLISNLYVEMIQLKKSMKNAEELTKDCYDLYRDMKKQIGISEYATSILHIAGEVHELKKDHHRIYAGLSKIMKKENLDDFMNIEEIIAIIVKANKRYSESLGKKINFEIDKNGNHERYHTFILLSIINNLVANAIEACQRTGTISFSINKKTDLLILQISDDGPGISEKHKNFIFQPGFTTKYNQDGVASSGIGLTYVKEVISHLNGTIQLIEPEEEKKTSFLIQIPIKQLTGKE